MINHLKFDSSTAIAGEVARAFFFKTRRSEGVRAVLRAIKNASHVETWAAPSDFRFAPATSPAEAVEETLYCGVNL